MNSKTFFFLFDMPFSFCSSSFSSSSESESAFLLAAAFSADSSFLSVSQLYNRKHFVTQILSKKRHNERNKLRPIHYLQTSDITETKFLKYFSKFFIHAFIQLCLLWYILNFNLLNRLQFEKNNNINSCASFGTSAGIFSTFYWRK